jgi:carbamoyltransferase
MKLQNILGISAGFHDAAASVINTKGEILFAGHSERYSKKKNDPDIHPGLLCDLGHYSINHVAYYERPWNKQLRQLYSGQGIEWSKLTVNQILTTQLQGYFEHATVSSHNHHLSHAAGGFQTSTFDRATVVVIDAVGEWDTVSIWGAEYCNGQAQYRQLWRQQYPHSIGLFYTAMTDRIGLRPMEDEYVLMGMSAYGTSRVTKHLGELVIEDLDEIRLRQNFHAGVDENFLDLTENEDIATATQQVAETLIYSIMRRARDFGWSTNLVYSGGVALNCLANRNLGEYFEKIWIMPCPGDSGSSLGAAALAYGARLQFDHAYLGHDIGGPYPVDAVLHSLLDDRICGVASGKAEFGPRALGNRSLLADPRGTDIKDQVNAIKRRQRFRPFAPVILEEYVDEYFIMPNNWVDSRYMQIVGHCRRPDLYPAVTHIDGTSRIQTVPKDGSGIRSLLEAWYAATGCPMLLNTSLNIRGEPMVNDRRDADRFEEQYNVRVWS